MKMNDWILHHIIENQSRYIREIIDYMLAYDNTDKADILKCSLIGMGIDNMLLAEQSGNFMLCNIMAKNLLLRMRQYKGLGIDDIEFDDMRDRLKIVIECAKDDHEGEFEKLDDITNLYADFKEYFTIKKFL